MDKVVLTSEDIHMLLRWRDSNVELVRAMPCPLSSIEIICKDSGYRIKGIRRGSVLKLAISHGYESLGWGECDVRHDGMLVHRKGKVKIDNSSWQSCLTVYCSLMALMTYGVERQEETDEKVVRPSKSATKRPTSAQHHRATYILHNGIGRFLAATNGFHASPRGIFTVRGHYRHYKDGRVVWISEYKKGTGKKRPKTYRLGPKKEGE